jgi:hypothetical protein
MRRPNQVIIQPPSILAQGEVGTGKTWLISTLAKAGLEVFVISTEPTGIESLLDAWKKEKLPLDKLHYVQVTPSRIGFEGLKNVAEKVSKLDFGGLQSLKPSGDREKSQWFGVLSNLANFKCQRDGKEYGPVDSFGDDRAVVVDSLSGLNIMAMDMVIGDKASAHQAEWGVAMGLIEKIVLNLTSNMKCTFLLISHLEREADELTGATKVMVSTLGKKLAPRLPRFFSEVVTTKRTDKGFVLDTLDTNIVTKTRSLPLSSSLPPTLQPVVEAYRERKKFAEGN